MNCWFPLTGSPNLLAQFIAIVYMRFLKVINPQDGNLWCRARYNPNILICQILTQNEHPQCSLSIRALCPSLLDNFGWTEKCYLGGLFTMLVIWKCNFKKEFSEWQEIAVFMATQGCIEKIWNILVSFYVFFLKGKIFYKYVSFIEIQSQYVKGARSWRPASSNYWRQQDKGNNKVHLIYLHIIWLR